MRRPDPESGTPDRRIRSWISRGLAVLGLSAADALAGATPAMTDYQTLALPLLRLPDKDLRSVDVPRCNELAVKLGSKLLGDPLAHGPDAMPPPLQGLALVAPGSIKMEPGAGLKVLVAHTETGLRRWQVDIGQNLMIVATDLDSGALQIWRPEHHDKRMQTPEPSASGAPPDAINAAATGTAVLASDLSAMLPSDGRSTRLAVTALLHDWASNTEVVDVRDGAPVHGEAGKASAVLRPAATASSLREDVASLKQDQTGLLRLAWRLPLTRLPLVDDAGHAGHSLARVHLLVVALDSTGLLEIALSAPVSIDTREPRRPRAVADLQLQLADVLPAGLTGPRWLWLVAGDRVAGPLAIQLP